MLLTVFLLFLHAVAFATPPEPLYLHGIQDAADYDSLIQPLVLGLLGVSVNSVSTLAPIGFAREAACASIPAALPPRTARLPQPRAPPLA